MGGMVKDLTPQDIASLGAYFAAKPGTTHEIKDWDLAGVGRYVYLQGNRWSGVAACQSCHGASGHGTTTLPRLAGQNAIYLEMQIKQFNTRERTNDNEVMHAVASKLTELEIGFGGGVESAAGSGRQARASLVVDHTPALRPCPIWRTIVSVR